MYFCLLYFVLLGITIHFSNNFTLLLPHVNNEFNVINTVSDATLWLMTIYEQLIAEALPDVHLFLNIPLIINLTLVFYKTSSLLQSLCVTMILKTQYNGLLTSFLVWTSC